MTNIQEYLNQLMKLVYDYSPKLITALIVLVFGIYLIRFTNRLIRKIMFKRGVEPTIASFLGDFLHWSMRFLLFVTFISKLGIETSSFVAILGAISLAVGLSLQGSLSNFAGGVLIILFKPFKVGDTIEAQGVFGAVSKIQIFVTKVVTANNQTIFIPNGILSNGVITNFSLDHTRRANINITISYETNIKKAKEIIMEVLENNTKILKSPAAIIAVNNLSDSHIHLTLQPWSKSEDFNKMCSDVLEECKDAFDKAGIAINP